ncbi:Methionyl-tRNA formyltransferase [Candidatus Entotheonellaceae bacterium PAL068K]
MRIVVHGQQAFGKSVLEALLERGENVIAVYSTPDKGQRSDPLKDAALARHLPVYQPKSFRRPEVWDEFAQLKADLCVMAYVTLFVPEEMLNLPTHGTIQYHPSWLPRHRGPSSINWPIIAGETQTGLTIFWPDNGLDTGPILLQKEVAIQDTDTLGSLYFDKLYPMGVEALLEAVDRVRDGSAAKIPQDEAQATYESWCKQENVKIDWNQPVADVWNMIRGADPQPGAWSTYQGQVVQIYDASKRVETPTGTPGETIAVSTDSFTVAANGGSIEIRRLRPAGGSKIRATEFADRIALQLSSRWGT